MKEKAHQKNVGTLIIQFYTTFQLTYIKIYMTNEDDNIVPIGSMSVMLVISMSDIYFLQMSN